MKLTYLASGSKVVRSVIPAAMLALAMVAGAEEKAGSGTPSAGKPGAMGPQFDKIAASLDGVKQSMATAMGSLTNFNSSAETKLKLLDDQIAAMNEVVEICGANGPIGKEIEKALQKTDEAIDRVKALAQSSSKNSGTLDGYAKVIADNKKDRELLVKNTGNLATQRANLIKNISILKEQREFFGVVIEADQLKLVNEAVDHLVSQMGKLNENLNAVTDMFKPASESVPPKQ